MNNLVTVEHKIRFKIDVDAVTRVGLTINARLLALSTVVRNSVGER